MDTRSNDYEQVIFDAALDATFAGHHDVADIYLIELSVISEKAYDECVNFVLEMMSS